ncbi:MAG: hypothetical protein LZF86_20031 [Nitrospira sp.]|nr:MAG: hypothetical protein LZF86_20031 [Nitrospira sp.]
MRFFSIKKRDVFIIVVMVTALFWGLRFFTVQSDAYQRAEQFAKSNSDVLEFIGPVSEVNWKFWSGFDVNYVGSGGEASFVFELKGRKSEAVLDVRMKRTANSWNVTEAYVTTDGQKVVSIKGEQTE